jgi:hypothetical protein
MYYKKSQKKNKMAIRLSKINRKKNFIGGKPPKNSNCVNLIELRRSVMNHMENITSCLSRVEAKLQRCQGGWAIHPENKHYIISRWIDDINELISIHNNISTTPMALLAYESNIGPTIFRQVLEYLQKYLLKLTTELNTFLQEVNALIALGTMESKDLQSRYIQKFKCPNIEKENEVTHSNPSVGAVARELNAQIIIPEAYICPITKVIMVDPVVASDGNRYEHSAMQERFRQGDYTSPKIGTRLPNLRLIKDIRLKQIIDKFCKEHLGLC